MTYDSILLTVDVDEAREIVADRVSGLRVAESRDAVEYRSQSGHHLAELSAATLPDGRDGARLRYRTTLLTPTAAFARAKARAIRDALDDRRYRGR